MVKLFTYEELANLSSQQISKLQHFFDVIDFLGIPLNEDTKQKAIEYISRNF